MCFKPVASPSGICHQGDVQCVCFLHFLPYYLLHLFLLLGIDGEVELVMYLKYHLRADALVGKAFVYAYHGHLDNVCLRTLYGGVDGVALGKSANGSVLRVYVLKVASALE